MRALPSQSPTPHNPALLCADTAALLPPGVVAARLSVGAPVGLLLPEEAASIRHCSEKRIGDFAAGRVCARRALETFQLGAYPLLPSPQGPPSWPAAMVGSITHTRGFAAAAVSRSDTVRSLGVDSEEVASVKEHLWNTICAAHERAALHSEPLHRRLRKAAVIFTAKEAFYKCQFPLSQEWINFADVSIEIPDWPVEAGHFQVLPQRRLRLRHLTGARLVGRFRFHEQFVTAAIAVPA